LGSYISPTGGTDIAFFRIEKTLSILWGNCSKMNYMHNMLISQAKQAGRRFPVFWLLWGLLLAGLFLTTPAYRGASDDYQNDPYITTWLTKSKARQIMRYHGTNAIKITADQVYIMRDGRWIRVYADPSLLPEKDDQQGFSVTAARAGGDSS
ncbi:MAG: hypothetical protein WBC70_11470, partial [Candidatus Aminicenantales bacterium]